MMKARERREETYGGRITSLQGEWKNATAACGGDAYVSQCSRKCRFASSFSGRPWWRGEWLSEVAMASEQRAMLVVVAVVAGGSKGRDLVGVGEVVC